MRSFFLLASLSSNFVSIKESLSSGPIYRPLSFPIKTSCPIYDDRWGDATHTIYKGDFCSDTPSYKGKGDAVTITCDKKIFPVIIFTWIEAFKSNNITSRFRVSSRISKHKRICYVIMANGPNDPHNVKCIKLIIKSKYGGKRIDWLIYIAEGWASSWVKFASVKKAFQQSDWLEEDMVLNRTRRIRHVSYLSRLLIQR